MPVSFWLADNKSLMVTSVCLYCEKKFNTLFSLSEMFKACPLPDVSKAIAQADKELDNITNPPKPEPFTKEDVWFLHALGVSDALPVNPK